MIQELIKQQAHWNEDIDEWELKCVAYTGNNMRKTLPQSSTQSNFDVCLFLIENFFSKMNKLLKNFMECNSRNRSLVALGSISILCLGNVSKFKLPYLSSCKTIRYSRSSWFFHNELFPLLFQFTNFGVMCFKKFAFFKNFFLYSLAYFNWCHHLSR